MNSEIWVYTHYDELRRVDYWDYPIEELVDMYPLEIYFFATLIQD